ncbi:MAG: M24 family metallopeptidase [Planctomycetes bacterium]|nr:M24 family metallopeptidase [Planctomycetota bacterium]
MNEKDARLKAFCTLGNFDGVLLRRRANIAWITDGADTHVDLHSQFGIASVLWTPERKVVYTDNIEAARLRDEELGPEWEVQACNWWEPPPAEWAQSADRRYATDYPEDCIGELRSTLTTTEIERIRGLGHDAAEVMQRVLMHDLKPGMTEQHLAGALSGWLRDRGVFAPVVLIAADDRIAKYRHPTPTARKIEKVVMAAVCAQRHGLIVSLTRLVHFGPISGELRRRHDAVCTVDRALHDRTRPGERWCDLLEEAVTAYRETGFAEEWKLHHQGGPMGYECRDFKATPTETRRVVESQVVGWNPSITGTKSEDTILSNGEALTSLPDWPATSRHRPDILVR